MYSSENPVNGKKPRFLNDLTVAEDGTVYMTDSSVKWDRRHNRHQIMEGEVSGRSDDKSVCLCKYHTEV